MKDGSADVNLGDLHEFLMARESDAAGGVATEDQDAISATDGYEGSTGQPGGSGAARPRVTVAEIVPPPAPRLLLRRRAPGGERPATAGPNPAALALAALRRATQRTRASAGTLAARARPAPRRAATAGAAWAQRPTRIKTGRYTWPRGLLAALAGVVVLAGLASGLALLLRAPSLPPPGALPGSQVWNQGVSSFLFGTNDSYEWSPNNIETQPAIQDELRRAGFTLVRTFVADKADDASINARVQTIEHIGAHCLVVLTNIADTSFNEHVVRYLGNRCLLYEFGNESDYNGITSDTYLAAWNATIPALRHINPAAKFIGPVTYNDQGNHGFMQAFLNGVKASRVLPDAISFHWYPCYNDSEQGCLAKAGSYADVARGVRQMVRQTLGKDLPVGISEWNYDPGNPPPAYGDDPAFITQFTTAAMHAMMAAGVAFACQFDSANYGGYGRLDMIDVGTNQPKPQFTALANLIQQYRPAVLAPGPEATPTQARASTGHGPLLSRGALSYCSANNTGPGGPAALVDGQFGNWGFWELDATKLPGWCAVRVGAGPKQLLFAWYSDYSFDYLGDTSLAPQGYTLAVSANSTNGQDGTWHTVVTVNDNLARAREHLIPFAGMAWIKMTVTAGEPHATQPYIRIDELQAFDAAALGRQTYAFSGDSITAMAYNRFAGDLPAFADLVGTCFPSHGALTLDEGFGGWTSDGAAQNIQSWLALNPDMHYWLIEWGTNDALDNVAPDTFRANLQAVVDAISRAGDVPILAHIPYSSRPDASLDAEIQALNAVIDSVTQANGLTVGPNLYALFHSHPTYLGPDGLHPSAAGAAAMNAAWYKTLRPLLTGALGAPTSGAACAG
ncbi:MAG TPA: GDSL-type esterase/lipase family protein [Ktedonobacterales bacterium]